MFSFKEIVLTLYIAHIGYNTIFVVFKKNLKS